MDSAPENRTDNAATTETTETAGSGTAGTAGSTGSTGDATFEQPRPAPAGPASEERLHRVSRGRMLGGVAAGAADYFDIDPTIVRIGFVALAFLGGLAVPLYLAGWLLIPDEDADTSVAEELLDRQQARSTY